MEETDPLLRAQRLRHRATRVVIAAFAAGVCVVVVTPILKADQPYNHQLRMAGEVVLSVGLGMLVLMCIELVTLPYEPYEQLIGYRGNWDPFRKLAKWLLLGKLPELGLIALVSPVVIGAILLLLA